jgi:hypothetical protein
MSEGGLLAWKVQKVKQPQNGVQSTCNFSDLKHPLPDPPKGQTWIKDGREWKMVPIVEAVPAVKECEMVTASVQEIGGVEGLTEAVAVSTAVPVVNCKTAREDEIIDGVLYHEVLETDTFQGICLRYKVTPTELRRANKMMGTNLRLAPKKLIIPINKNNSALKEGPREMTKEEQIAKLACEVRNRCLSGNISNQQKGLSYSEARAYLEMNDWDMESPLENAVEDFCWSSEHN